MLGFPQGRSLVSIVQGLLFYYFYWLHCIYMVKTFNAWLFYDITGYSVA